MFGRQYGHAAAPQIPHGILVAEAVVALTPGCLPTEKYPVGEGRGRVTLGVNSGDHTGCLECQSVGAPVHQRQRLRERERERESKVILNSTILRLNPYIPSERETERERDRQRDRQRERERDRQR